LHQSLLTGGLPFPIKLPKPSDYISYFKTKTASSSQSVDDFFKDMEFNIER
jgi:hypothetical protein